MLELQIKYFDLLRQKEGVEKKLNKFQDWDKIKSQYKLSETSKGGLVFIPNKNHPSPKPIHYLCANCFQEYKVSYLQVHEKYDSGFTEYFCPNCKLRIDFNPSSIK